MRNHAFMKTLRDALHTRVALPVWPGMAEVGAWMLGTDVELMRKSRRALPQKLLDAGFVFEHPTWATAAPDLADRWEQRRLDLAA